MIKANELRIGNIVHTVSTKDILHRVVALGETNCGISNWPNNILQRRDDKAELEYINVATRETRIDYTDLVPVQLTTDILEKCGFEKCDNGNQLKVFEGYVFINSLFSSITGLPLTLEIDGNRMPLKDIRHIHQLQNLCFAVTGQELQVNL
jgi:hypothetical protein